MVVVLLRCTHILTRQIDSEFRDLSKYGVKMALAQRRAPILANIRPVKMCSHIEAYIFLLILLICALFPCGYVLYDGLVLHPNEN